MDRSLRWRSIILLGIVALCVLSLLPSLVGKKALPKWYTRTFAKEIQLGLDLQGGLHIVYSIDLDKAVDDKGGDIKRDLETKFAEDETLKQKPVVRDGQIVIGDVMLVSLSFDHRIIDGHIGAAFAYEVIGYLENPDRLFLEMA